MKFDLKARHIMAAVLGVANAGCDDLFIGRNTRFTPKQLGLYYRCEAVSLESAVHLLVGDRCEDDSMMQGFVHEARAMLESFEHLDSDGIIKTWALGTEYAAYVVRLAEEVARNDRHEHIRFVYGRGEDVWVTVTNLIDNMPWGDGPRRVVHDVGTRVWIYADHSEKLPPHGIRRVGDGVTNGFDMDGTCMVSVPQDWCDFHTTEEAHSIMQCMEADAALLRNAR